MTEKQLAKWFFETLNSKSKEVGIDHTDKAYEELEPAQQIVCEHVAKMLIIEVVSQNDFKLENVKKSQHYIVSAIASVREQLIEEQIITPTQGGEITRFVLNKLENIQKK